MFIVAALYKFAPLEGLADLRERLVRVCAENGICGTLLLAPEGINGTVAGSRAGIDALLGSLRALPPLAGLEHKESYAEDVPFLRMKVRLKKEIVTIGLPEVNPNETVGAYLSPAAWNEMISDPDTIILDTRNDYEVALGTFKGAVNPQTRSFSEFPDYVQKNLGNQKHRKVAMFCTGGIRCEKASSYMKAAGFDEVYHLKGGILKYLEEVPPEQSLWDGECFVFDRRVSVGHGLKPGNYTLCPSCRLPISEQDRVHEKYLDGVACPACYDALSPKKRAAAAERHRQIRLAEERGERHVGAEFTPRAGRAAD